MFVDGFQIASQIQQEDPDVMDFLTKRPFQFQYLEDGVMLFSHKCLLRLDPITGQIQQFSFNNDDRFGEWIDQEEVCFTPFQTLNQMTDWMIDPSKAPHLLQIPQDAAIQAARSLQRAPNETAARSNGRHQQLACFAWKIRLYGQEEDDRCLHANRHLSQQTPCPLGISISIFNFIFIPLYLSVKHKTILFLVAPPKQTTQKKEREKVIKPLDASRRGSSSLQRMTREWAVWDERRRSRRRFDVPKAFV